MFMLQVNGVIANASFMTRSLDSESKPWQFARVVEDTRWEHVTSLHPNNMPAELTSNQAEMRHTILTGCKLYFPNDRCSAISYIRLLLDDSMLKAHQHRIGLEASNSCDCGLVIDDIENFLLQCTLYDDLRHALKHDVTNVWERCGSRRSLKLSVQLLVFAFASDQLTYVECCDILSATFNFIRNSQRQL